MAARRSRATGDRTRPRTPDRRRTRVIEHGQVIEGRDERLGDVTPTIRAEASGDGGFRREGVRHGPAPGNEPFSPGPSCPARFLCRNLHRRHPGRRPGSPRPRTRGSRPPARRRRYPPDPPVAPDARRRDPGRCPPRRSHRDAAAPPAGHRRLRSHHELHPRTGRSGLDRPRPARFPARRRAELPDPPVRVGAMQLRSAQAGHAPAISRIVVTSWD